MSTADTATTPPVPDAGATSTSASTSDSGTKATSTALQPAVPSTAGSGGPGSRGVAGPGSDEGRIGLRANLRHIGALVRRNALQIKADPESMFDVLLMPIIFTLLFVYVFGGSVGASLGGSRDDYVNYVVPGLMAMMGMNIAMSVGTGVNDDFRKGVMDRFRTMPIARSSVLIAKIFVEIGRMLVATAILLGMGFLLGMEVKTSVLELLAAVGLSTVFGASLMWIFILLGLTMKTAQSVQGVAMLVLMPLQFGSSIFAPPSTMPGWLQAFTDYNPLSNLADAARALLNGGPVAHSVWMTLAWAAGITLITAPLAVAKFRKKS
jgi:oleandomycin transport system permease protein